MARPGEGGGPDPSVLARARAGEARALAALAGSLAGPAWRLAWRLARHEADADDLAQEVLMRVLAALPRYDPDRPFLPWFYRVASNCCLKRLRGRSRRAVAALPPSEGPPEGAPGPAAGAEAAERRRAVQAAVAALPPDYRAVVALKYLEDLGVAEIARALEVPEGTVKVRLFRARAILRRRLAGWVETPGDREG